MIPLFFRIRIRIATCPIEARIRIAKNWFIYWIDSSQRIDSFTGIDSKFESIQSKRIDSISRNHFRRIDSLALNRFKFWINSGEIIDFFTRIDSKFESTQCQIELESESESCNLKKCPWFDSRIDSSRWIITPLQQTEDTKQTATIRPKRWG